LAMSMGLNRRQLREPTRFQRLAFCMQAVPLEMLALQARLWRRFAVVSGHAPATPPLPRKHIISVAIVPVAGESDATSADSAAPGANIVSPGAGITAFYAPAVEATPAISKNGKLERAIS
jgi:hypothetical protein